MKSLFFLILTLIAITSFSNPQKNILIQSIENNKDSINKVQARINIIEYELGAIKRDKINYNIEKNILKDSFSNSMQVLNIILASLLLFVSIIGGFFGYLGFKNISETKAKFSEELSELVKLRNSYRSRFTALLSREKEFLNRMKDIEETNKEQSRQIHVLELKNQLREAFKAKSHSLALALCDIGIKEAPTEYYFYGIKGSVYADLLEYNDAYYATLKAMEIVDKSKRERVVLLAHNLLEFSLFANKQKLYKKHKEV